MRRNLATDPDYDPEGDGVKFRLTYEGLLLGASRENKRAKHKHEIRRVFHTQLRRLFELHPAFFNFQPLPKEEDTETASVLSPDRVAHDKAFQERADNFTRCGYRFFPLATRDYSLQCAVHILFLRPDKPGGIIKSGDIDNRLKTIFDALKIPASKDEMGGFDQPSEDENPFFCLLEDDSLVSHVSLETDTLLQPIGAEWNVNDVRMVLTIHLSPYRVTWGNIGFAG